MKFLNVVGPQIRKLRYQRGWSQSKLAAKLQIAGWDISRSGLAKIESKLVWVGDYELFYFIRVFQVDWETLFPKIDSGPNTHDALQRLLEKNRPAHGSLLQAMNSKRTTASVAWSNGKSLPPQKTHRETGKTASKPKAPFGAIPAAAARIRQQNWSSAVACAGRPR
jgi:transcriptional regulator with XRE-family HTH domain